MFTSTVGAPIAARTPDQPAQGYSHIMVTPASPHIGAEVTDIDLTRELSVVTFLHVHVDYTRKSTPVSRWKSALHQLNTPQRIAVKQ